MKKTIAWLFTLLFLYSCTPLDAPLTLTPNTFTDSRDGHVYKTTTIGNQIWMAENMAYLPEVYSGTSGSVLSSRYYVLEYYGTDTTEAKATEYYATYGALYNWQAAAYHACPDGWHLPSDEEWTQLLNYLKANGYNYNGSTTDNKVAISMTKPNAWTDATEEGTPGNTDYPEYRNITGFSALPSGCRATNMLFDSFAYYCHWWSSTNSPISGEALNWGINYNTTTLSSLSNNKRFGFSVRCVKD